MKTRAAKKKELRLGIYGGTFDPIHHGHLILAGDALEQLKLDAILFIPCRQSPHKSFRPLATDARRVALLELALKGESRFWLSRCEIDREGPSYSVDTALEIGEAFPNAKLFWLIGADQLAALDRWHRIEDLRQLVTFALLARNSDIPKRLPKGVLGLPQPRRVDISATEIRQRVKSRRPVDHLVPLPVAAYIKRHRLYLS